MSKLLPCPFCGCEPQRHGTWLRCTNEKCAGFQMDATGPEWNTRAPCPDCAEKDARIAKLCESRMMCEQCGNEPAKIGYSCQIERDAVKDAEIERLNATLANTEAGHKAVSSVANDQRKRLAPLRAVAEAARRECIGHDARCECDLCAALAALDGEE